MPTSRVSYMAYFDNFSFFRGQFHFSRNFSLDILSESQFATIWFSKRKKVSIFCDKSTMVVTTTYDGDGYPWSKQKGWIRAGWIEEILEKCFEFEITMKLRWKQSFAVLLYSLKINFPTL